jgi:hypothetical protein
VFLRFCGFLGALAHQLLQCVSVALLFISRSLQSSLHLILTQDQFRHFKRIFGQIIPYMLRFACRCRRSRKFRIYQVYGGSYDHGACLPRHFVSHGWAEDRQRQLESLSFEYAAEYWDCTGWSMARFDNMLANMRDPPEDLIRTPVTSQRNLLHQRRNTAVHPCIWHRESNVWKSFGCCADVVTQDVYELTPATEAYPGYWYFPIREYRHPAFKFRLSSENDRFRGESGVPSLLLQTHVNNCR